MAEPVTDFSAVRLISVPDDDERWKEVAPMTALGNGRDVYVRESEYPEIRKALIRHIGALAGEAGGGA